MKYETVIGLEVHAQLLTKTKIFCGCSTLFGQPPNSQTCPICLGLPGVLPVLNRQVVELGIRMGLATHGRISPCARFARKNYFYPDLPKGYQISMYELPLTEGGYVEIVSEGIPRKIGLVRIHMEEDAGKNLHEGIAGASHVDMNRAGVPLLEIVGQPELSSPQEAVSYLKKLRELLIYAGVSDGDMEKGNFRCDANISLRPAGTGRLGTRAEVKNMNSFRFVQKALEYEIDRQGHLLDEGGKVIQETRLWDTKSGATFSMRSKEEAHDYRYFPEPDLVPIHIAEEWIDEIAATLPELPDAKRARFVRDYTLPDYDALVLTATQALADFYEKTVALYPHPKAVSNWMMSELLGALHKDDKEIGDLPIHPGQLASLLQLIEDGKINGKIAKTVFEQMAATGKDPDRIVQESGLAQVSDTAELGQRIDAILLAHPKEVAGYRAGKEKLIGFFVGEVMKQTSGQANPARVNQLLKERLSVK